MLAVVGTAANWPIIGQISWLLGHLMNWIYSALEFIGIQNIGISIIIFTIIIFTLMLPITIKQQKNMKLTAVMQPEIQKVQAKYKGKRDQATMAKQQEEINLIYEKYGSSPVGGCLPMLLQMPVFFALWPVIRNIPSYVTSVRNVYSNVITSITSIDGWLPTFNNFIYERPELRAIDSSTVTAENLYNILYRFQDSTWDGLKEVMPEITYSVNSTLPIVNRMNFFMGVNIGETPLSMFQAGWAEMSFVAMFLAVVIPILAGVTQFISVKLQPTQPQAQVGEGQIGNSMKAMTYTMPLFSVFMGFTLPAGMGLYWAASALVRVVHLLLINAKLKKIPVEELIKQSQEKAAKKRERKGVSAGALNKMAQASARNIEDRKQESEKLPKATTNNNKAKDVAEENVPIATKANMNAKPGSLASKANLVSRYNSGYTLKEEESVETPDESSDKSSDKNDVKKSSGKGKKKK